MFNATTRNPRRQLFGRNNNNIGDTDSSDTLSTEDLSINNATLTLNTNIMNTTNNIDNDNINNINTTQIQSLSTLLSTDQNDIILNSNNNNNNNNNNISSIAFTGNGTSNTLKQWDSNVFSNKGFNWMHQPYSTSSTFDDISEPLEAELPVIFFNNF